MEITTAVFEPESKYAKTTGLWQYDYGQILRLQGLDLPKAVEIHFSLSETGGESVTRIGTTRDGVTDVLIPDSMLENNDAISDYSIFAFVFLTDDKSGNTEYRIKLSVKARPRPEVPGSPEEPELFRETIKEVNQAADRSEEARDQAEAWAHGRDDYPDCEEDNAKYYAAKAADSASAAEKSSENADKTKVEVEKLAESIKQAGTDALKNIQDKELRSKQNITSHADDEINRINKNVGIAEENLQGTIRSARTMQQDLEESISQAETMKTAVDQSAEDAGIEKQELDKTISKATDADSTLSKTINTASTSKIDLDKTIQDATELDNNLDEKITEGIALNKTLQDTSSKAVSDIQIEADTQLQRVQTAAEGIEADREQINANTEEIDSLREDLASGISRITSVEELKADKISLAKTDKKLDTLWKLNQGVSYEFQNDDTASYQKTVPTGAKLASIQNIGGKTIVWNQLAGPVAAKTENGLTVTVDKETSKFTIDGTSTDNTFIGSTIAKKHVGHKVLFRLGTAIPGTKSYATIEIAKGDYLYMRGNDAIHGKIIEIAGTDTSYISWYIYACETGITFDCITYTPQIFDLTQMFGIGNEPSTVEEFEAMFPAKYYPCNEGELMSMPVSKVVLQGRNLLPYPYEHTTKTMNGIIFTDNGDGTITVDGTATDLASFWFTDVLSLTETLEHGKSYRLISLDGYSNANVFVGFYIKKNGIDQWVKMFNYSENIEYIRAYIQINTGESLSNQTLRYMLVEDNGIAVSSYSSYKAPVVEKIPQTICDLPGYGWSAGTAYNYVDLENKQYIQRVASVDLGNLKWHECATNTTDYIKMYTEGLIGIVKNVKKAGTIGDILSDKYVSTTANNTYTLHLGISVEINGAISVYDPQYNVSGTSEAFTLSLQGSILYYELAEPIITDISDIISDTFQEPIEVEAGGTLTFRNIHGDDYQVPVPNTEEYVIKLSEVVES